MTHMIRKEHCTDDILEAKKQTYMIMNREYSTLTPLENSILTGAPATRAPCSSRTAATASPSRRKLTNAKFRPGSRAISSTSPHRRNSSDRSDAVTPGARPPTHRCRDGGATPQPDARRGCEAYGSSSTRAPWRDGRSSPRCPLANLPGPTGPRRPLAFCKNRRRIGQGSSISDSHGICIASEGEKGAAAAYHSRSAGGWRRWGG